MNSFFLPEERDLEALAGLEPDRDWREFVLGQRAWILQTFLRLERAGVPVRLVDRPPFGDVVLFHAKHERHLRRFAAELENSLLVGVRADNREPLSADLEVVQNQVFADGRRRHFLPHWPQPGLEPRDERRAERVERVAFKGFLDNLHPDFISPAWPQALAGMGMEWQCDATRFAGAATDVGAVHWPSFDDVDVVVAVRPTLRQRPNAKPATKLVNAWQAGVPAILGPEPAFRELRRSPLDYLEVQGAADAVEALRRLRADPALYRAMVENGRARGREFGVEATLGCWSRFLSESLPTAAGPALRSGLRRLPLGGRRLGRFCARLLSGRPAR